MSNWEGSGGNLLGKKFNSKTDVNGRITGATKICILSFDIKRISQQHHIQIQAVCFETPLMFCLFVPHDSAYRLLQWACVGYMLSKGNARLCMAGLLGKILFWGCQVAFYSRETKFKTNSSWNYITVKYYNTTENWLWWKAF